MQTDGPDATSEKLSLIAYEVASAEGWEIVPAPYQRQWMDESPGRGAYRCLPLSMANQAGWIIRAPFSFTAVWDGSPGPAGVKVELDDPDPTGESAVQSHFGVGIVTFRLPFLFRTPPGIALLVRGAANWPVLNFHALEGLVETDWNPATFTMNWRIMEANRPARFEREIPVCFIQPFEMDLPERLDCSRTKIGEGGDVATNYAAWRASRSAFLVSDEAKRGDWQKDYFQGIDSEGRKIPAHRVNFQLGTFADPGAT